MQFITVHTTTCNEKSDKKPSFNFLIIKVYGEVL